MLLTLARFLGSAIRAVHTPLGVAESAILIHLSDQKITFVSIALSDKEILLIRFDAWACCRLLNQSYQDRREAARKMRKDTMNAVEISFNSYLHQRGFTGGLSVNRGAQELQLEVLKNPPPQPSFKCTVPKMASLWPIISTTQFSTLRNALTSAYNPGLYIHIQGPQWAWEGI